jgi:hypothetical protein
MSDDLLKVKLSMLLGCSVSSVERTPFVELMKKLVCIIEEYEGVIHTQHQSILENETLVSTIQDYLSLLQQGRR